MAAEDTAKISPGILLQPAPEKEKKDKDKNEFPLFLKLFIL